MSFIYLFIFSMYLFEREREREGEIEVIDTTDPLSFFQKPPDSPCGSKWTALCCILTSTGLAGAAPTVEQHLGVLRFPWQNPFISQISSRSHGSFKATWLGWLLDNIF